MSREACRKTLEAVEWSEQGCSAGEWYWWYVSDEIGTTLFQQHYQHIKPPSESLVHAVAMLGDSYAFGPDNGIVLKFTPEMVKNPLYQPPVEPPRA